MSQRRERVEEAVPDELWTAIDRLRLGELYHVPVLVALLTFMLWNRVRTWENFVTADGAVLLSGNDAWYHLRETTYTVNNWPTTMPYDVWTRFPTGTSVGQFGTLYDQLVATAALVVGLGDPSSNTIAMTVLFVPAVVGTLVAIPTYFLGKRFGGRLGGIVAVLLLALTPTTFLRRSLVGFSDHHIAEVLFQATAFLVVMVALTVAEREKPIYELVANREFDALRRPLYWGIVAGLAVMLYIWVWPPAILILGILGVFFGLKLPFDYVTGESPDYSAFVGAVLFATTLVLSVLTIEAVEITVVQISLSHVLLSALGVVECVAIAWLARTWESRDLPDVYFPGAVALAAAVGLGLFALLAPDRFAFFADQVLRVFGYTTNAAARTVGEAKPIPLDQVNAQLYSSYGVAIYAAVVGAALALWQYVSGALEGTHRSELLLLVVWALFMFAATLTQQRFNYYLVVPVATLVAHLVGGIITLVGLDALDGLTDVELYHVITVFSVLLLVTGPFVAAAGASGAAAPGGGSDGIGGSGMTLSTLQSADRSQPGEIQQWDSTFQWMRNETPEEGRYGLGDDAEALPYLPTVEDQADYQYPDGTYGVMAWWDYGHFITARGQRIPFANPFQQNAGEAADYLLATDPETADDILASDSGERTRYVMLDWKLAYPDSRKYTAPTIFYDGNVSRDEFSRRVLAPGQQRGQLRFGYTVKQQRHYDSMRVRLYEFHGSAVDPQPVVVDYEETRLRNGRTALTVPTGQNQTAIRQFPNMEEARNFVENDSSAQVGGIGGYVSEPVPALEHYRLVKRSPESAFSNRLYQTTALRSARNLGLCKRGQPTRCLREFLAIQQTSPAWVKTFERVPGATVEGSGAPPNTNLTARVRMRTTSNNGTFVYRQHARSDENGEFTMTLPYSTTGYENWGTEEGYTNVSVRADGPYEISTPSDVERENGTVVSRRYNATVHVPEGAVIGEDTEPVAVTLEEQNREGIFGVNSLSGPGTGGARPAGAD